MRIRINEKNIEAFQIKINWDKKVSPLSGIQIAALIIIGLVIPFIVSLLL